MWPIPRRTLRPPVSKARLTAAGLPSSVFVGDRALVNALKKNRACSTSRQSAPPASYASTRPPSDLVSARYD